MHLSPQLWASFCQFTCQKVLQRPHFPRGVFEDTAKLHTEVLLSRTHYLAVLVWSPSPLSSTYTDLFHPAHFNPRAPWMGESAASLALLLPVHCGARPGMLMRIFSYQPPVSSVDLVETYVFQIYFFFGGGEEKKGKIYEFCHTFQPLYRTTERFQIFRNVKRNSLFQKK